MNPVYVALDTTDLDYARQLAERVRGSVGGLKLGLEFFSAHGPDGVRGFGAFSVKVRPSRMGRNPRTGEPVSVGQKRAPFFRTGKELRERLNGGTPEP